MATFQELKDATDAAASARASFAIAQAALNAKNEEVGLLVTVEQDAFTAASIALEAAYVAAQSTVGWDVVNDAFEVASQVASDANGILYSAATQYDGS